jgi:hypothetical protein
MAVTADHDNNQTKENWKQRLGQLALIVVALISAPTFKFPD